MHRASTLHYRYSERLAEQRGVAAHLGSTSSQEHYGDLSAIGLLCYILSIHYSFADPPLPSKRGHDRTCSPINGEEQHQSSALLQVFFNPNTGYLFAEPFC